MALDYLTTTEEVAKSSGSSLSHYQIAYYGVTAVAIRLLQNSLNSNFLEHWIYLVLIT